MHNCGSLKLSRVPFTLAEDKSGALPLHIITKPSLSWAPIKLPSHPDSHYHNGLSWGLPFALLMLSGNIGIKAILSCQALALGFPPLLLLHVQT